MSVGIVVKRTPTKDGYSVNNTKDGQTIVMQELRNVKNSVKVVPNASDTE